MRFCRSALTAVLVCAGLIPADAGETRAVVELFTSQGCSSCPPADRLMGQLSQDSSLVTLSLPVDYWDYLGWKDTLALQGNAVRQREYAIGRGDREVYTPQAVINGVTHALGSDQGAIEQAIMRSRQHALSVPVKLSVSDGMVAVHLPASSSGAKGEVWLCPVTAKVKVKVGRGENSGRTLDYYNVVRRWVRLGQWNGQPQDFNVPLSTLPDARFSLNEIDHVVAILQDGAATKPGLMLGAASAPVQTAAVR